jgi:hypothetical protein
MKLLKSTLLASALLSIKDVTICGETSDDPDFTDMTDLVDEGTGSMVAKLYYRLDALDEAMLPTGATTDDDGVNAITMKMVYDGEAWLGVGLSPDSGMVGSEPVIGVPGDDATPSKYGPISSKNGAGVTSTLVGESEQTLMNATIAQIAGQTMLTFTTALSETGEAAYDANGKNTMAFAIGESNSFPSYHSNGRNTFMLDLASVARPTSDSGLLNITNSIVDMDMDMDMDSDMDNSNSDSGSVSGLLEILTSIDPNAGMYLHQNTGMMVVVGACTFALAVVSALF